jgi:Uma2 family endonuclease
MVTRVADRPAVESPRLKMSYEEYLAWEGEGRHGEWVDGEVIVFMPKPPHQRLVRFLGSLVSAFVELLRLGEVLTAPCEMRIRVGGPSREPDILFVETEHLDRITGDRVEGPADLVVEIISPDSVRRDRFEKKNEYEAAGIPEYWVVDSRPGKRRTEFHQLGPNGKYVAAPVGRDGRYHAAVLPGFWLDTAWLWQDPLPAPSLLIQLIAPEAYRAGMREMGIGGPEQDGR